MKDLKWPIAVERFRSPQSHWTVQEFDDWNELVRAVSAAPWSFSVIEVSLDDLAEWLRAIRTLGRMSSNHRVAVVGSNELDKDAVLLAEAGAVFCGSSLRDCPRLAGMIDRFVAKFPLQPLPLRETILLSLPWSSVAADRKESD